MHADAATAGVKPQPSSLRQLAFWPTGWFAAARVRAPIGDEWIDLRYHFVSAPRRGQHWRQNGCLFRVTMDGCFKVEAIQDRSGRPVYGERFEWSWREIGRATLVQPPPALLYEYTAFDAVEDGVFINTTCRPRLAAISRAYRWPVLMSVGLQQLIDEAVRSETWHNDWPGVWNDIVTVSRNSFEQLDAYTRRFQVAINGQGDQNMFTLIAESGPAGLTDPRPVVKFYLPHER